LAAITPGDLDHVYFASDGASATEAALKIAIQYWANTGRPERRKFVALDEGYHGDTLGAVGVGFVPSFHWPFEHAVQKAYFAEAPHLAKTATDEEDKARAMEAFASMEAIVREHHAELAGVILEPLCQGAAGIRIYHPEYLRRVRALCDEYDLLLIADEIAVGFARTGKMFACDHAGITPDIMCFGKALTGGYLPMSATVVTDRIYDAFRNTETQDRTFYDGHTFCGNPITSAAAIAALDEYARQDIVHASGDRSGQLAAIIAEIGSHEGAAYYKTLGMIGMVAFSENAGGAAFARTVGERAWDLGLFIRPLDNVLYLWPPLNVTEAELAEMGVLFKQAVEETAP
jgi:adenosylmethionine---8-amino-7-oxononanoate aminotransferase